MQMKPQYFWAIVLIVLLSQAACTPPAATRKEEAATAGPAVKTTPPPLQEEPQTAASEEQPPSSTEEKKPGKPAAPPTSPRPSAVAALMQEADENSASGSLDNAAATLERAIRIQPRNALLWQKLAEVRLRQQQPGLAEDLAKKSNILAKSDKALTKKNWSIIAQARRKRGDMEGANEADARAK